MNRFLLIVFAAVSAGCTTLVKMPESQAPSLVQAQAEWSAVLQNFVDNEGWVDFPGLQLHPSELYNYIGFVSAIGPHNHPELFPTPNDRLAFYLNSYNALSMYNVLAAGIPKSNSGFSKISFFMLRKLTIGGQKMSLKTYEDDTIRAIGDPRVHFALNCMAVSCPVLTRAPFKSENLDADLNNRAKKFFSERRNFYLDREKRIAWVSEILDFFPKDFLKKAPTLADFINQYAVDKIPADFKIRFIPYDWTVINQANRVRTH